MNTIEQVARAILAVHHDKPRDDIFQHMRECYMKEARSALKAIHEPDPHAVAKAADVLNITPTLAHAVWTIMIERMMQNDE